MEPIPSWQANRASGGREISPISWNPMVHCVFIRPHNASFVPIQMNPVRASSPISWRRILILSSQLCLGLKSDSFFRFPHQKHCIQLCQNFIFKGINPLNPELNPICYLLALWGAHHFLHVSRIRVKSLTFRRLMPYIWSTHSWCF